METLGNTNKEDKVFNLKDCYVVLTDIAKSKKGIKAVDQCLSSGNVKRDVEEEEKFATKELLKVKDDPQKGENEQQEAESETPKAAAAPAPSSGSKASLCTTVSAVKTVNICSGQVPRDVEGEEKQAATKELLKVSDDPQKGECEQEAQSEGGTPKAAGQSAESSASLCTTVSAVKTVNISSGQVPENIPIKSFIPGSKLVPYYLVIQGNTPPTNLPTHNAQFPAVQTPATTPFLPGTSNVQAFPNTVQTAPNILSHGIQSQLVLPGTFNLPGLPSTMVCAPNVKMSGVQTSSAVVSGTSTMQSLQNTVQTAPNILSPGMQSQLVHPVTFNLQGLPSTMVCAPDGKMSGVQTSSAVVTGTSTTQSLQNTVKTASNILSPGMQSQLVHPVTFNWPGIPSTMFCAPDVKMSGVPISSTVVTGTSNMQSLQNKVQAAPNIPCLGKETQPVFLPGTLEVQNKPFIPSEMLKFHSPPSDVHNQPVLPFPLLQFPFTQSNVATACQENTPSMPQKHLNATTSCSKNYMSPPPTVHHSKSFPNPPSTHSQASVHSSHNDSTNVQPSPAAPRELKHADGTVNLSCSLGHQEQVSSSGASDPHARKQPANPSQAAAKPGQGPGSDLSTSDKSWNASTIQEKKAGSSRNYQNKTAGSSSNDQNKTVGSTSNDQTNPSGSSSNVKSKRNHRQKADSSSSDYNPQYGRGKRNRAKHASRFEVNDKTKTQEPVNEPKRKMSVTEFMANLTTLFPRPDPEKVAEYLKDPFPKPKAGSIADFLKDPIPKPKSVPTKCNRASEVKKVTQTNRPIIPSQKRYVSLLASRQPGTPLIQQSTELNHETISVNQQTNSVNQGTSALNQQTNLVKQEINPVNQNQQTTVLIQETDSVNQQTNLVNQEINSVNQQTFAVNRHQQTNLVSQQTSALNQQTNSVNQESNSVKQEQNSVNQNQQTNSMSQQTSALNQQTNSLNQQTISVNQGISALNQQTISVNQESNSVKQEQNSVNQNRQTNSVNQQTISVNQKANSVNQQTNSVNQPTISVKQQTNSVNPRTMSMNQPTNSVNQGTMSMNQPTNSVNQPTMSVNQQINSVNQQINSVNQGTMSVNQQTNSVNQGISALNQQTNSVNQGTISVNQNQQINAVNSVKPAMKLIMPKPIFNINPTCSLLNVADLISPSYNVIQPTGMSQNYRYTSSLYQPQNQLSIEERGPVTVWNNHGENPPVYPVSLVRLFDPYQDQTNPTSAKKCKSSGQPSGRPRKDQAQTKPKSAKRKPSGKRPGRPKKNKAKTKVPVSQGEGSKQTVQSPNIHNLDMTQGSVETPGEQSEVKESGISGAGSQDGEVKDNLRTEVNPEVEEEEYAEDSWDSSEDEYFKRHKKMASDQDSDFNPEFPGESDFQWRMNKNKKDPDSDHYEFVESNPEDYSESEDENKKGEFFMIFGTTQIFVDDLYPLMIEEKLMEDTDDDDDDDDDCHINKEDKIEEKDVQKDAAKVDAIHAKETIEVGLEKVDEEVDKELRGKQDEKDSDCVEEAKAEKGGEDNDEQVDVKEDVETVDEGEYNLLLEDGEAGRHLKEDEGSACATYATSGKREQCEDGCEDVEMHERRDQFIDEEKYEEYVEQKIDQKHVGEGNKDDGSEMKIEETIHEANFSIIGEKTEVEKENNSVNENFLENTGENVEKDDFDGSIKTVKDDDDSVKSAGDEENGNRVEGHSGDMNDKDDDDIVKSSGDEENGKRVEGYTGDMNDKEADEHDEEQGKGRMQPDKNCEDRKIERKSTVKNGKMVYVCKNCGKTKYSKWRARRHIFDHHPFRCETCEKTFLTPNVYSNHMTNHMDKFYCTHCSFVTDSKLQLKQHKLSDHGAQKDFLKAMCYLCGLTFDKHFLLQRHMKQKHQTIGEHGHLLCLVCKQRFRHSTLFRYHLMAHLGWFHHCSYDGCSYKSPNKFEVSHHVNSVHVRTLKCHLCSKVFGYTKALEDHLNVVHYKERKYKCENCNKGFLSYKHLLVHKRIHSDEKPYACEHCDYRGRQQTALNWHMKKQHPDVEKKSTRKVIFKFTPGRKPTGKMKASKSSHPENELKENKIKRKRRPKRKSSKYQSDSEKSDESEASDGSNSLPKMKITRRPNKSKHSDSKDS